MLVEDLDFQFDFLEWCRDNGVNDKEQYKRLFFIIEKYFTRRSPYSPWKGEGHGEYPDYRSLRKKTPGLKMEAVAQAVGISKVQMHYIETHKTTSPNLDTLSKLNIYYGLTGDL